MKIELREDEEYENPNLYIDGKLLAYVKFFSNPKVCKDLIVKALTSLQEPEPEYIYEVDVNDVKIGQSFIYGKKGNEFIRFGPDAFYGGLRVEGAAGKIVAWNVREKEVIVFCRISDKIKVMVATDPAACTVGDLDDWDWCKYQYNNEKCVGRRIPNSADNEGNVCVWDKQTRGIRHVFVDTSCIRIKEPEE